jgi:hypothetical protein
VGVGERKEESVKRVVDRSLDLKHVSIWESLQRLCLERQSQQKAFPTTIQKNWTYSILHVDLKVTMYRENMATLAQYLACPECSIGLKLIQ